MPYTRILPDVVFEIDGARNTIKDIRYYSDFPHNPGINIKIKQGDRLDAIASRRTVYGEGSEDEAFRIFEHNAATLMDNNYEMEGIKILNIPLREG